MIAPPAHHRRAFVLLAVLIITGSALLVATALISLTTADAATSVNRQRSAQSRALTWSGLQVVSQRLHEQRETILRGMSPELDEQYEIYEAPARLGVVRLLSFPSGDLLIPEAGRLDANHADAAALVATGLIEQELADAIIAWRDRTPDRPVQSIAELLQVEGVTPELLYGPLDELVIMPGVGALSPQSLSASPAAAGERPLAALADVLTVFAAEPALQRDGVRRIRLDLPWSDELARRCERRFGPLTPHVQALFQDSSIKDDADIVGVLRQRGVPASQWPDLLDAFTAEAGELRHGRIDLNTAPYEVLATLPGIDPAQASLIVRQRDQLSEEQRGTIAWPVLRNILDAEQFEPMAGRLTTRSFTYRVRLASGEVDASDPDGPLIGAVITEAVIDLCDPEPRVAYLRDVTLLDTAAFLAASGALLTSQDTNETEDQDQVRGRGQDNTEAPPDAPPDALPDAPPDAEAEAETAPAADDPDSADDPSSPDAGTDVSDFAGDSPRDGQASAPLSGATSTPAAGASTAASSTKRIGRWKRGDS